ncbi:MAG: efflux RND transporter periplasmic adaptor subunit [Thermodesulfobacteriota bacterium]
MFRKKITLTLVLIVLLSVCACSSEDKKKQEKGDDPAVEVAEVETRDLKLEVMGIGTLKAEQSIRVRPELNGIVQEIHFQEGDKVEKGQLLFTIKHEKIKYKLQAEKAALSQANAQLDEAKRKYKRYSRLYKKGATSVESRDEAKTAYHKAKAGVEQIKSRIAELEETLQDAFIRASFSGRTGDIKVDPGAWVQAGTSLVDLVQDKTLQVSFTLPERYMGDVEINQSMDVLVTAYPDKTFQGRVYFISPSILGATRSILLKGKIDNQDKLLSPGAFASVKLALEERKDTLVIPEQALVATQEGYTVYTVNDGTANRKDVQIGLRKPGIVEIKSGLQAGEKVVSEGHINISDGDKVRVINQ